MCCLYLAEFSIHHDSRRSWSNYSRAEGNNHWHRIRNMGTKVNQMEGLQCPRGYFSLTALFHLRETPAWAVAGRERKAEAPFVGALPRRPRVTRMARNGGKCKVEAQAAPPRSSTDSRRGSRNAQRLVGSAILRRRRVEN
ncbi:hypothetical protein N658DRAFT_41010 [Parathielavia hyrcaniae]|uniref:Uncharacterized protein n=1 Tax=Parathielavia hyrcaniae TaxID=113614 RepID=A0AAN6Q1I6_9PEZI|nr:hypothetical protein N658DRAFT_41010 [Parathielavia hyrcaniae]